MSRIAARKGITLTVLSLLVMIAGCPSTDVVPPPTETTSVRQVPEGVGVMDDETVGVPPTTDNSLPAVASLEAVSVGDIIVGPGANFELFRDRHASFSWSFKLLPASATQLRIVLRSAPQLA